ncbi:AraC family transcriptional regulator [Sulfitobacter mediterraneus]|uniref:helix-turn-helix domain-containing protein n=1 Tax=Sulfitobacter mediterraneus TaxID=83219 RepID=UPI0019339F46|nr:helix-turn-helix domain-containing protein [Sulfitobacter mediterraneus]MBM1640385.1 AraC family transcriptional regulator [Sulfitobacter mediterraneus]MBM1644433.1 AraC family transcriptional regulator [Sulfitobacter mediterraneus]MBM1652525.1 AraC family transcriptional regulator [Sulfitobacter mediterraneus]MBM1656573.1 AraC family transcriptional regulator [Sulfitobacter mediterraneus]MBM1664664.1 AraC family transcriptional regulator [Sulfitobacter mediterraneus]
MIPTVEDKSVAPISKLFLPPAGLADAVFAGILRDTRGCTLSDADRLNHFPASPLVSVSFVIEGGLRILPEGCDVAVAHQLPEMDRLSLTPPQASPTTSWSDGPVYAISVGLFPDAWEGLSEEAQGGPVPAFLEAAIGGYAQGLPADAAWAQFCAVLMAERSKSRPSAVGWSGGPWLSGWSRSLMHRAALAGPGRSLRAMERRIKRWSGQSRQTLAFHAAIDRLHQISVAEKDAPLAAIAVDAGFADQSHMGRAVRRATGFSPAKLNRMIETQEAFWCYRLLGERF